MHITTTLHWIKDFIAEAYLKFGRLAVVQKITRIMRVAAAGGDFPSGKGEEAIAKKIPTHKKQKI